MTRRTQPRLGPDVPRVIISQLYGPRSKGVVSIAMSNGYSGLIRVELTVHEDHVVCSYRNDEDASSSSRLPPRVRVEWQPVGEEGRRAWFVCGGCGKRRRSLYLIKAGFGPVELVCRSCGGFRYPSQDVDPVERLASEISGIHARLGSQVSADPYYIRRAPWPARPKGVHMRIYRELLADLAAKQSAMEGAIIVRAQRVMTRRAAWLGRHS